MRITVLGAAGGEVTGSSYFVETERTRLLVDFGLFQGKNETEKLNRVPKHVDPRKLDAILVTHGHLDHTGRLPLLTRARFHERILATPATIDLTGLILRDAAKVQMQDVARINRKRERAGKPPREPLYSPDDVEELMRRFEPAPYNEPVPLGEELEARFVEAGHMLGSTSIELRTKRGSKSTSVVFSGDLGPRSAPILKEFEPFKHAEHVFLESTYGDRDHKPLKETVEEFITIVAAAVQDRGKMLVPTFAVGRAQLILVLLAWAFRNRRIPPFPVYLDSPMAIEASRIYTQHAELFDDELKTFLAGGRLSDHLARFETTPTAEDSRALNLIEGPAMILAGAGMCNAGRILHHLRQNLWKSQTHVLIVGYQADGTIGRQLVDGKQRVKIFGEEIAVKAKIHTLGGFSAHAGQSDLLEWLGAMASSRPNVYLTHGEDRARKPFAEMIQKRFGLTARLPDYAEVIKVEDGR